MPKSKKCLARKGIINRSHFFYDPPITAQSFAFEPKMQDALIAKSSRFFHGRAAQRAKGLLIFVAPVQFRDFQIQHESLPWLKFDDRCRAILWIIHGWVQNENFENIQGRTLREEQEIPRKISTAPTSNSILIHSALPRIVHHNSVFIFNGKKPV